MKKYLFVLLLMTVPFITTAQLANDNCSNATVLQINPNLTPTFTTPGTIAGATASAEANTCAGADDDDIWYQFTATHTSHHINITDTEGSTLDLNHVVYEGNNCGTLIQKYCSDPNSSTARGLTIGQTYKIRIYSATLVSGQTTTFNINITTPPAPPVNDDCSNAITLTANPYYAQNSATTTSTLYQATASVQNDNCNTGNLEDVWFKFVATSSRHKIVTSNITGSINYLKYSLYTGTCQSLTVVTCFPVNGIFSSLTPGQTYMIRASAWSGASAAPSSFTVTLSNDIPENDSCSTPTIIIPSASPNCTGGVPGDLRNASPFTTPTCSSGAKDVWYEFTATSTTHYIWFSNVVAPTEGYLKFSLFSGNCSAPTVVRCSSYSNNFDYYYSSFVPGQNYKICVTGVNSSNISFNICVGSIPSIPPVNDTCANATSVVAGTTPECTESVEVTIGGATNTPVSSACGIYNKDVWYTFVATSTRHVINLSNITGGTTTLSHSVFSNYDCTGSATSVSPCYGSKSTLDYVIGQTYKIRVSLSEPLSEFSTFKLCITTPVTPANDNCPNAIQISASTSLECTQQINGTTVAATKSPNTIGCMSSNQDVWYKFTAISQAHVVTCLLSNGYQASISLFTGDYNNPTLVTCAYPRFSGLTIGQEYMIRVGADSDYDFTLCVSSVLDVTNDTCASAQPIALNQNMEPTNTTTLNLTVASDSTEGLSCASTFVFRDVWYTFTATNTTHYLLRQSASTSNSTDPQVALYTGNCGTLSQIYCNKSFTNSKITLNNLVIGQSYKLRVYVYYYDDTPAILNNITIALLTPPAVPVNDNCSNPTLLTINPVSGCSQPVTGTFSSATVSTDIPSSFLSAYEDVWYQFTATNTTQKIYISDITGVTIVGIQLFEGICGTLTSKGFFYPSSNSVISGLTPGSVYKFRLIKDIYTDSEVINSFKICLTQPDPAPANDECPVAAILPVNPGLVCTSSVNGTLMGATKSTDAALLAQSTKEDVWYKFTATAAKHHINVTGNGITYMLYSGTECGALTYMYSETDTNSIATNLTIGSTYTIRITKSYSNNTPNEFTICIGTPVLAANDECSNAITLIVSPGEEPVSYQQGSLQLASFTPITPSTGCGTYKDLWYKFTATSTLHYIDMYGSALLGIYPAADCSSILCSNAITLNNNYAPGLTIGQTYYIRVQAYSDQPGELKTFEIAVTTPQPIANDNCANAIVVPVNSGSECELAYTANLAKTQPSDIPVCNAGLRDLWVKFTATNSRHTISITDPYQKSYSIFTGDNCISLDYDCNTYPQYTSSTHNFTVGQTYMIRIQTSSTNPYTNLPVELCITTPATCSNPENLLSGYNEYVFAPTDIVPYVEGVDCLIDATNTKWFSVNITNPGDIEYTISMNSQYSPQGDPIGQDRTYPAYLVWGPFSSTEQGCENLSSSRIIRCSSAGPIGKFTITGTVAGEFYVVLVSNIQTDAYIKFEQTGGTAASGNVPAPTGDTNQDFGPGQTLADIEMNDDVTWYANPGEPLLAPFSNNDNEDSEPEIPLPLTTPLVSGTTYYAAKKIYNIESFVRFAVTVNFAEEVPAPTGPTQQDFYSGETLDDLEITGENIKWYNNNEATVALPSNTLLTDGASYSASQTVNGLESIQRLTIIVNEIVTTVPPPTGPAEQTFSEGETLADLEVTGENIKWYNDSSSTQSLPATTLLVDGYTYYASQTINEIESTDRLAVTVVAIAIPFTPAPTGATEQSFTEGETLANLEVTGENIKWYADNSSVQLLPFTTVLVDGNTYYASQTINEVESTDRLAVSVNLVLSTNSNTFASLLYYPNPVTGILNIENTNEIEKVTVANALGQKVFAKTIKSNKAQIDTSSISRGVYFVTVTSEGASTTIKIIKE